MVFSPFHLTCVHARCRPSLWLHLCSCQTAASPLHRGLLQRLLKEHDEVQLSALGTAVSTMVSVAEILKKEGYVVEKGEAAAELSGWALPCSRPYHFCEPGTCLAAWQPPCSCPGRFAGHCLAVARSLL